VQGSRREPLALRHSAATFWVVALLVLALDQAVKMLVRSSMFEGQSIPLVQGVFHLTFVRNVGAAFGLLPGYQPVFILTSCVVLLVVAAYWRRARPTAWPIVIALGLIVGGAAGNLIDRAYLGKVTDIFDFTFIDFPVFNIADTAIVVGVGILIAWLLFAPEPATADANAAESAEAIDAESATKGDHPEVSNAGAENVPAVGGGPEADWL